jgi:hypothetical protein
MKRQTYCDMMGQGRNHESETDSHCKIMGRIILVTQRQNNGWLVVLVMLQLN